MNLFTFPFYASIEQQSRFLGCGQVPRALPAAQSRWLPFVLKLPISGQGLDCVRIYRAEDDKLYKTVPSSAFSYDAYSDGEQDYIFYYGGLVNGLNMPCDTYYLESRGYFSEVFTVVRDTNQYIRLQWNSEGGIYQSGFYNLLFLDSIIAEPTYKIDEEGEDDAEGNFVAQRTRVEKTLKLDTLLLPEFLIDALAGIALHSNKQIGRYSEVNGLKVTPTWNKKGCAATVEITFMDGAATTSEGCGTSAAFMPIDLSGFVPAVCDGTGPDWVSLQATRCEVVAGKNTGWVEVQQRDQNILSGTYNQTRWVRLKQDATACPVPLPLLRSREIKDIVYRTNCLPNQDPGFVTYVVPEGKYTGYDQAVLDKQALDFFNAEKEAFANANATCTLSRKITIESYRRTAKQITVNLLRSDTAGDCVVRVTTEVLGDAGNGLELHQEAKEFTIPAGQSTYQGAVTQSGYVVSEVKSVLIDSVTPSDYSVY